MAVRYWVYRVVDRDGHQQDDERVKVTGPFETENAAAMCVTALERETDNDNDYEYGR